jgi:hypothetical protein
MVGSKKSEILARIIQRSIVQGVMNGIEAASYIQVQDTTPTG